jgi:hypothetical protein
MGDQSQAGRSRFLLSFYFADTTKPDSNDGDEASCPQHHTIGNRDQETTTQI